LGELTANSYKNETKIKYSIFLREKYENVTRLEISATLPF